MLLTDGLPNVNPPRGELETLRRYLDSYPEQRAIRISTFGFGYSLKSRLLSDLAKEGGSIYAFIPDASFVGTVFINSIANILSAASPCGATLKLEAAPGVQISNCISGQKFTPTSWGAVVEIPCILYGQSVDVLVELTGTDKNPSKLDSFSATLEMPDGLEKPLETQTELVDPLDPEDAMLKQAAVRSELISFIKEAEVDNALSRADIGLERSQQLLKETKERVAALADGTDLPGIQGIRQDLEGQITEAYSKEGYYRKWGSHYVLSLAGAHTLQQCINFKDPGIQEYATGKFKAIRDKSEEIFLKLDPPKPSRRATAPVATMRSYYSSSAPCFAAGKITLVNGEVIDISQVQPGQKVMTSQGSAIVKCVVETPCPGGTESLVELDGGVLVTPWHPVRRAGSTHWAFPCFLGETKTRRCNMVYSFVLEGNISMKIGAFDGIALGHGMTSDPILEHAFLGTDRVLQDLSTKNGWNEGRVRLDPNPAIRENGTKGRIVGFQQTLPSDASLEVTDISPTATMAC